MWDLDQLISIDFSSDADGRAMPSRQFVPHVTRVVRFPVEGDKYVFHCVDSTALLTAVWKVGAMDGSGGRTVMAMAQRMLSTLRLRPRPYWKAPSRGVPGLCPTLLLADQGPRARTPRPGPMAFAAVHQRRLSPTVYSVRGACSTKWGPTVVASGAMRAARP